MSKYYTTYFLAAVALICVVVLGLMWRQSLDESSQQAHTKSQHQAYLLQEGRCLQLDVADSPQERRDGLSNFDSLADNQGMIFLYEESGTYGFWMKDMSFPIDIIWLDKNNRVVKVKRSAQPASFPETFSPDRPAKKVIETPSGWTEEQNIKTGDQLTLVEPTATTPGDCGSD